MKFLKLQHLKTFEVFPFDFETQCVTINACWSVISNSDDLQSNIICDLDLVAYIYDDRGRLIEKLDSSNRFSHDGLCNIFEDSYGGNSDDLFESIKISLINDSPEVEAILLVLEGGMRNYKYVESVGVVCLQTPPDKQLNSVSTENVASNQNKDLFQSFKKTQKDYHGISLGVCYKNGWFSESRSKWCFLPLMEPVYEASIRDIEDKLFKLVVRRVPSLTKHAPRLFNSLRELCTALSSTTLPSLKQAFLKLPDGLPLKMFTEVLFKQLYLIYPNIIDIEEGRYVVALLEEMFNQIDYNGDMFVNWDEFTSFCIQSSLVEVNLLGDTSTNNNDDLDEYVIEYNEEILLRDRVLSNHRQNVLMRFIPTTRKILIVPENSDKIILFSESFKVHSELYPSKIKAIGNTIPSISTEEAEIQNSRANSKSDPVSNYQKSSKTVIYDVIYLYGKDLYCFSTSEHTIELCKEHLSVTGKALPSYHYYNRILHSLLHVKLCWNKANNLLCSVASTSTIFGWDIGRNTPLFQINRHSDNITDMISLEEYDLIASCSMDKKIIMWSAKTRRVRTILLGHTRGVKTLDYYRSTLLSSGFECEARTWDIELKDPIALLQGHRYPIQAAKLMCKNAGEVEKDYRAVTVDEAGEFRLWNIYVKERTGEAVVIAAAQVFSMQHPERPLDQFRFMAIIYNETLTRGLYSDIIACSTKLFHFAPHKSSKEFVVPSYSTFHEMTATLYTCLGCNLIKYDMSRGKFLQYFAALHTCDISCIEFDTIFGRRMFIGCINGDLLLVNSISGSIIEKSIGLHTQEITGIVCVPVGKGNRIFTSSLDGTIKTLEEFSGVLNVNNSIVQPFGENIGIVSIKAVSSFKMLLVVSSQNRWGLWDQSSLKKKFLCKENSAYIMGTAIIGVTGGTSSETVTKPKSNSTKDSAMLITIALALVECIQIYTIDISDGVRGIATMSCSYSSPGSSLSESKDQFVFPVVDNSSSHKVLSPKFQQLMKDRTHGMALSPLSSYQTSPYIIDFKLLKFPEKDSVNNSRILNQHARLSGPHICAVTDDGIIYHWDVSNVREESEALFYKAYFSKNEGNVSPTKLSKQSSIRNFTSSLLLTPMKSMRFKEVDEGILSSDVKEDKLGKPSNNSQRESLSTNVPFSSHLPALETSFSLKALNDFEDIDDEKHYVKNIESRIFYVLDKKHWLDKVFPKQRFLGHIDMIPSIIDMANHGCYATVSYDGFHRVWNADQVCLGELALPNLTDKMKLKHPRIPKVLGWRFVLEKISISSLQQELTLKIISQIRLEFQLDKDLNTGSYQKMMSPLRRNAMAIVKKNDMKIYSIQTAEMLDQYRSNLKDEELHMVEDQDLKKQKLLRDLALQTLSNPLLLLDDFHRNEDTGLPTQHQVMSKLTKYHSSHENFKTKSFRKSIEESLWHLPSERLSLDANESKDSASAAFSLFSLNQAKKDGYINTDEYKSLLALNRKPEKIAAYERSQPTILLRNAKLSTSFNMSRDESVEISEVQFGPQKNMYSNAALVLKEKTTLNSSQMWNSVATSRINHSVKSIKTMIHVLPPVTVSDNEMYGSTGDKHIGDTSDKQNVSNETMNTTIEMIQPQTQTQNVIDMEKMNKLLKKLDICRAMDEMEANSYHNYDHTTTDDDDDDTHVTNPRLKIKRNINIDLRNQLESKLIQAMRDDYRTAVIVHSKSNPTALSTSSPSPSKPGKATKTSSFSILSSSSQPTSSPSLSPKHGKIIRKFSTQSIPMSSPSSSIHNRHSIPSPSLSLSPIPSDPKLMISSMLSAPKVLTTRFLLPFYKLEDVLKFMNIFMKCDIDGSGELDVHEWINFFTSLNRNISIKDARMSFMQIDKNQRELISLSDLVPVLFPNASLEQKRAIIVYAESIIIKKNTNCITLTQLEIDQLFEVYDDNGLDFIPISLVRDRIKSFHLPDEIVMPFLDSIMDIQPDEMINLIEFNRIFRQFISKSSS